MGEMAPAPVSKIGYYGARTPDVARLADYYADALGLVVTERSDTAVYLTTGGDHHCVVIEAGEHDGRARLGFEVRGSLDDAAAGLDALGVPTERRSDPEPGITEALIIQEPWSDTTLTLFSGQAASGVANAVALRPTKLGHVASYVPELQVAQRFYTDVLGFRWSDTIGDFFTFLRCNADHHAINLMASAKRRGLFHVAFEMRDIVELKNQLDHLSQRGYHLQWGPGRHGAGHNIFTYHRDPDGNYVELFTEIDIIADEATGLYEPRPWHETWPQGPKVWKPEMLAANKWGPIDPEMMEH